MLMALSGTKREVQVLKKSMVGKGRGWSSVFKSAKCQGKTPEAKARCPIILKF